MILLSIYMPKREALTLGDFLARISDGGLAQ